MDLLQCAPQSARTRGLCLEQSRQLKGVLKDGTFVTPFGVDRLYGLREHVPSQLNASYRCGSDPMLSAQQPSLPQPRPVSG